MSYLTDVKKMIVDGAHIDAALVFRDFVPTSPDIIISLLGYGTLARVSSAGGAATEVFGTTPSSIIALPHRLQVMVRGVATAGGYDAATATAASIWEVVFGVEVTINGHLYHSIIPQQGPFFLDRDESRRPILAWNVEILAAH
jgi:hypothetical protein